MGSRRAPNLLVVLRIPFATARILPWPCVKIVTIRSASPSLIARSTTPSSRYKPGMLRRLRSTTPSSRETNGSGSKSDRAEPSVEALELLDGAEEMLTPEVGPQHIGEVQLRVRELPQQIVR